MLVLYQQCVFLHTYQMLLLLNSVASAFIWYDVINLVTVLL